MAINAAWQLKTRAHQCDVSGRAFEKDEWFHTAIYDDPKADGFIRRDIAKEHWAEVLQKAEPIAHWVTKYIPVVSEVKPEVADKESALSLLQRFIKENESHTERTRYILALMLERKKILVPTAVKETESGKILFYQHRKTQEVMMILDPELLLSEIESLQDEVSQLLGLEDQAAVQINH
jgi:hypothetical protein